MVTSPRHEGPDEGGAYDPLEEARCAAAELAREGPPPPERPCPRCDAVQDEMPKTGGAPLVAWVTRRSAPHRLLHAALEGLPQTHSPDERRVYLDPAWDDADGRPVLREPGAGTTSRSVAFFVLHRPRFGRFVAATMGDDPTGAPHLRLYDDRGRVLELRGVAAGYRGEGARGAVTILRLAGFADAWTGADAPGSRWDRESELERRVYASEHVTLRVDGGSTTD